MISSSASTISSSSMSTRSTTSETIGSRHWRRWLGQSRRGGLESGAPSMMFGWRCGRCPNSRIAMWSILLLSVRACSSPWSWSLPAHLPEPRALNWLHGRWAMVRSRPYIALTLAKGRFSFPNPNPLPYSSVLKANTTPQPPHLPSYPPHPPNFPHPQPHLPNFSDPYSTKSASPLSQLPKMKLYVARNRTKKRAI
jgi:hypothetical protein